jgi:hypothetical protein
MEGDYVNGSVRYAGPRPQDRRRHKRWIALAAAAVVALGVLAQVWHVSGADDASSDEAIELTNNSSPRKNRFGFGAGAGGQGQGGRQGGPGQGGQQEEDPGAVQPVPEGQSGPKESDFVDIRQVQPNVSRPDASDDASTGTFRVDCGVNAEGRFNTDNVIVAPGVRNGAHHTHDYVGNDSTDFTSTDESLAAAGTTCDGGDLSTYYWPALRQLGTVGPDADQPGGGLEGNVGRILTPASVEISYRGSPQDQVVSMPRFLRIITGDAKAGTNGGANANAKWTCTGFEDRVTTKYPLCPDDSQVLRVSEFQSCWDGQNTDSENHRTHVAFQQEDGECPEGTVAIPQLVVTMAYDVPPGPSFAVDGFPEQLHDPITDHNDFINVMPDQLMAFATQCINSGRNCEITTRGTSADGKRVDWRGNPRP